MTDADKTIFISYRREPSKYLAAYVYKDLVAHGYDVFWDISGIDSGDFAQAILNQIAARMHFVVILAPESVKRFSEPNDWLRREIEMAMDLGRNVVPIITDKFDFKTPRIKKQLTGKLENLSRYQYVSAPLDYLDEAMKRLRTRFLVRPQYTVVIAPTPSEDRAIVEQTKAQAQEQSKPTESELTAEEYFQRGLTRGATDYDGKIADYTEAIRLNPQYAAAYNNRGNARGAKGDFEGALNDFNEAISLAPNQPIALTNRAIARYNMNDYDGSKADSDEAIRINPQYADAYHNRGNARKGRGDVDGAIADYDEAIRFNPHYAEAYNNRGNARIDKNDYDGAKADYDEAIRLNPKYAEAYNNRGNIFKAQGDFVGAITDYTEAIRLNKDYATAYYNRGNARRIQGDIDSAIADYTDAIRLNQQYANAYNKRGLAYFGKGEPALALEDLDKAINLHPTVEAYRIRGDILMEMGELDEALADYRKGAKLES